jgi:hypothetical protein
MVNNKKVTATTNGSSLAQQKVIPPTVVAPTLASESVATSNKQQQHTNVAVTRLQNVLKNHASHQSQKVEPSQLVAQSSLNLWSNNNNTHEHNSGKTK